MAVRRGVMWRHLTKGRGKLISSVYFCFEEIQKLRVTLYCFFLSEGSTCYVKLTIEGVTQKLE